MTSISAKSSRLLEEIAVRVVRLGAGYSKDVIARIREITGFTKEQITDDQLKPFAVAALKYMGAFKSRPKATVQPVQPIAPLATSSAVEPPNALLRVWRD